MRSGMVDLTIYFSAGLKMELSAGKVVGARAFGLFIFVSTAPATMVKTLTPKGESSRRRVLE